MYLRKAAVEDCIWIYEILEELRQPVTYSYEKFETYFKETLTCDFFQFLIFCNGEEKIGLISLNKFCMPRYLGYGYEMEEFVIHKNYRGKGLSYKMIEAMKEFAIKDVSIRKLLIKSNADNSKHIYGKALNETALVSFQIYLNKL